MSEHKFKPGDVVRMLPVRDDFYNRYYEVAVVLKCIEGGRYHTYVFQSLWPDFLGLNEFECLDSSFELVDD